MDMAARAHQEVHCVGVPFRFLVYFGYAVRTSDSSGFDSLVIIELILHQLNNLVLVSLTVSEIEMQRGFLLQ